MVIEEERGGRCIAATHHTELWVVGFQFMTHIPIECIFTYIFLYYAVMRLF